MTREVRVFAEFSVRVARPVAAGLLLLLLAAGPGVAQAGPAVFMTRAMATGTRYEQGPSGTIVRSVSYFIRDSLDAGPARAPRDTVPAGSRLDFEWRADAVPPATAIVAYRFRLDGPVSTFFDVDTSVHLMSYNTGFGDEVGPGVHNFEVVAIDDLGAERSITRYFQMGFAPGTWFAGPDPNDPVAGWLSFVDGNGKRYTYRNVGPPGWSAFAGVPGTQLGPDSADVLPALRPVRNTFFEIYGNRLWLRQDGDTVNMNSWIMVPTGGADHDSPYTVQVDPALLPPALVGKTVLTPGGGNGSPVGFVHGIGIALQPAASPFEQSPFSALHPVFDADPLQHAPTVGNYAAMTRSGRAYFVARAVDGDGYADQRISDLAAARTIVQHVESGTATITELALRSSILSFHVNRSPVLRFAEPDFFPKPAAFNGGAVAESPDRVLRLRWFATDPDPVNRALSTPPVGGPSGGIVLRYQATIQGRDRDAVLRSYTAPAVVSGGTLDQDIDLALEAPAIVSRELTVKLQLCDCVDCEADPGHGRCVEYSIPVVVAATLSTGSPGFALALEGLRPNPAGAESGIAFTLPDDRPARLAVFDLSGRLCWSREVRPGAGRHVVPLGRALAPGVYLVRLTHGGQVRTTRAASVH